MEKHIKAGKLYSFESFKAYGYEEDRTYNGHDDDFGTSKRSKLLLLNRKKSLYFIPFRIILNTILANLFSLFVVNFFFNFNLFHIEVVIER